MASKSVFGFLSSFQKGINSDSNPRLLPPDQLSYATNATMRGFFVHQRPAFNDITIVDTTNGATLAAFQTGLYQGSCYYRNGSLGYIMVAVNGKLFQIAIIGNTATLTQLTLPDSGNSTTATQNWMWQSERFLIWNDGSHLPIFWDGLTARRSFGPNFNTLGIVTAAPAGQSWVVPLVGQPLVLELTAPYTGVVGIPVLLGTANYELKSSGSSSFLPGYATLAMSLVSGFQGDNIPVGALVSKNNQNCGVITAATTSNGYAITNFPGNVNPVISATLGANPYFGAPSNPDVYDFTNLARIGNFNVLTSTPSGGNFIITLTLNTQDGTNFVNYAGKLWTSFNPEIGAVPGTAYFMTNVSPPNVPTEVGNQHFILTLSKTFLGNVSDVLTVGTAQFQVTSINGNQITCLMVNNNFSAIPIYTSGTPTTAQIVTNTSASGMTTVGSYPTNDVTGSPNIPVPIASTNSISIVPTTTLVAGDFLYITDDASQTNIYYLTSVVTLPVLPNPNYVALINNTDTPGNVIASGTAITSIPELPVSTIGVYGMGRNWVATPDGTHFLGSDLVGSSSGTNYPGTLYNFTDAVLKVSQNAFLAGGTTFYIPGAGEVIAAMQFVASIDASLGQGFLQVFTNDTVFSCNAPADATTWKDMTSPILTESLVGSGAVSQDDVTQSSSDLIFRMPDSGVQSLSLARLDFNQWGNPPISKEINRIVQGDDRNLLKYCSAAVFNNRRLMACNPVQTARGVIHTTIASLNYDPKSSLSEKSPSNWEGAWTGRNVLKIIKGAFNNVDRCFALCLDSTYTNIILTELLADGASTKDNGTDPITWSIESASLFEPRLTAEYKRLANGELAIDKITDDVTITAYYRPDDSPTWIQWFQTKIAYQGASDPGFRPRIGLGEPSPKDVDTVNNRPWREGYDYFVKLVIVGSCELVKARHQADLIDQPEFAQPKRSN